MSLTLNPMNISLANSFQVSSLSMGNLLPPVAVSDSKAVIKVIEFFENGTIKNFIEHERQMPSTTLIGRGFDWIMSRFGIYLGHYYENHRDTLEKTANVTETLLDQKRNTASSGGIFTADSILEEEIAKQYEKPFDELFYRSKNLLLEMGQLALGPLGVNYNFTSWEDKKYPWINRRTGLIGDKQLYTFLVKFGDEVENNPTCSFKGNKNNIYGMRFTLNVEGNDLIKRKIQNCLITFLELCENNCLYCKNSSYWNTQLTSPRNEKSLAYQYNSALFKNIDKPWVVDIIDLPSTGKSGQPLNISLVNDFYLRYTSREMIRLCEQKLVKDDEEQHNFNIAAISVMSFELIIIFGIGLAKYKLNK